MASEGDSSPSTSESGAPRSPGLIPALAFILVIVVALAVVAVLRQIVPAASNPSPTLPPATSTTTQTTAPATATLAPPAPTATRPPAANTTTATSVPTATAPATPLPTTAALTVTPAATAIPTLAPTPALPPVALGIPPVVYSFYDWQNTNFAAKFPAAGPIGSLAVFGWNQLHTGPDQYRLVGDRQLSGARPRP